MVDTLKKIVISLSVALIVGLTGLAYADPKTYRALGPLVALAMSVGVVVFWIWSLGAESRERYDGPNPRSPMMNAVIAFSVWFAVMAYLVVLYLLPNILETKG